MKNKKSAELASFGAALLVLLGVVGIRSNINAKRISEPIEEAVVTVEPQKYEEIRYIFQYTNDTVDVDESIKSLNISESNDFPYKSYKFIRFVNFDNHEIYAIVNVYVDYLTDVDKNVVETVYRYVDAFSGRVLLTTNDRDDIVEFNSDVVQYLMEYGSLLELRESVISKGLNTDYAYSVMDDSIKNKSLSTYDVARYYVLLVNSKNRLEQGYMMSIG